MLFLTARSPVDSALGEALWFLHGFLTQTSKGRARSARGGIKDQPFEFKFKFLIHRLLAVPFLLPPCPVFLQSVKAHSFTGRSKETRPNDGASNKHPTGLERAALENPQIRSTKSETRNGSTSSPSRAKSKDNIK